MARPKVNDETVRGELIAAAIRLLAAAHPRHVSVRQIASEAGSSATAIYTLFGGKDGLVDEVRRATVNDFYEALAALPVTPDPLADLATLGATYMEWARTRPNLYGALFTGIQEFDPQGDTGEHDPAHVLTAAVNRALEAGLLVGPPSAIALTLWTSLHGAVVLERDGALSPATADLARAAVTDALLRGWAPGPAHR